MTAPANPVLPPSWMRLIHWKLLRWLAKEYTPGYRPSVTITRQELKGPEVTIYPLPGHASSRHLSREAKAAVLKLEAQGFLGEPDKFRNRKLTPEAVNLAEVAAPPPASKRADTFGENEQQMLSELEYDNRSRTWVRARDLCGVRGVNKAEVLRRLARLGYAEASMNGKLVPAEQALIEPSLISGSARFQTWLFRITDKGLGQLGRRRQVG
jgi:hypothetical protein